MKKSMFSTRSLVKIALFVSMSIILKSFLSIETQMFRVSFFDIPLMILGIVAGPFAGFIGGFITDLIHVIISPFAFTFNFFTVATIMWGLIPGLFLFKRNFSLTTIIMVVSITSVAAFAFNTLGIYQYYGMASVIGGLLIRVIVFLIKLPIQIFLVKELLNRLYLIDIEEPELYTK